MITPKNQEIHDNIMLISNVSGKGIREIIKQADKNAQEWIKDKMQLLQKNKKFVTGNIISQQAEEEAFRNGWFKCFYEVLALFEEGEKQ
jgi:hypothetical protein